MGLEQRSGFILLHRRVQDSWLWDLPHAQLKVAISVLMGANWQDGQWRGEQIARGELVTSVKKLAMSTGATVRQVRDALGKMSGAGMISTRTNRAKGHTRVTVLNYDTYQDVASGEGNDRAMIGQCEGNDRATSEQENKRTREQKTLSLRSIERVERFDLDKIYGAYPKKAGKAVGLKRLQSKIKTEATYAVVLSAAEEMRRMWTGAELKFCPAFATWVNQERWQDPEQTGPSDQRQGTGKTLSSTELLKKASRGYAVVRKKC